MNHKNIKKEKMKKNQRKTYISDDENTLSDSNWKDTFDKFIADKISLGTKNILRPKRKIRASFNRDSSVYESSENTISPAPLRANKILKKKKDEALFFSTPINNTKNNIQFIVSDLISPVLTSRSQSNIISEVSVRQESSVWKNVASANVHRVAKTDSSSVVINVNNAKNPTEISLQRPEIIETEFPKRIKVQFPRKSTKSESAPKKVRKTVAFNVPSHNEENLKNMQPMESHKIFLAAGKWRKSLINWRKSQINENCIAENSSIIKPSGLCVRRRIYTIDDESAILVPQSDDETHNQIAPESREIRPSRHFSIGRSVSAVESGNLSFDESSNRKQFRRQTHSILRYRRTSSVREEIGAYISTDHTHRGLVLRYCGQSEPLCFDEVYSGSILRNCRKIGEGVYSEVFMYKNLNGRAIVLKVIPIEGDKLVNDECQKKFEEILSEIIITAELSKLKNGQEYRTGGFADLVNVRCVQGRYPENLIELWELYRDNHGTDNDHPEIFDQDQLYIVLELGNGGQDLEAFNFKNALQAYSAFIQVALSLAVGEQTYEFEHRDLHWGNILISNTDDKEIEFLFNGELIAIPSHGVRVTIIDYTLSRMVYAGECQYNDLSQDEELFSASGDYQFDIYRLMRNQVNNHWEKYEPFNNILWLHYVIDKMINGARYRLKQSKKHRDAIQDMMHLRDDLLDFKSASDYAQLLKIN